MSQTELFRENSWELCILTSLYYYMLLKSVYVISGKFTLPILEPVLFSFFLRFWFGSHLGSVDRRWGVIFSNTCSCSVSPIPPSCFWRTLSPWSNILEYVSVCHGKGETHPLPCAWGKLGGIKAFFSLLLFISVLKHLSLKYC